MMWVQVCNHFDIRLCELEYWRKRIAWIGSLSRFPFSSNKIFNAEIIINWITRCILKQGLQLMLQQLPWTTRPQVLGPKYQGEGLYSYIAVFKGGPEQFSTSVLYKILLDFEVWTPIRPKLCTLYSHFKIWWNGQINKSSASFSLR